MDPIATARYGMFAAAQRLDASASRTARMGFDSDVDLGREAVEQVSAKHQFTANLQVVRAAAEMWRALSETQNG